MTAGDVLNRLTEGGSLPHLLVRARPWPKSRARPLPRDHSSLLLSSLHKGASIQSMCQRPDALLHPPVRASVRLPLLYPPVRPSLPPRFEARLEKLPRRPAVRHEHERDAELGHLAVA